MTLKTFPDLSPLNDNTVMSSVHMMTGSWKKKTGEIPRNFLLTLFLFFLLPPQQPLPTPSLRRKLRQISKSKSNQVLTC